MAAYRRRMRAAGLRPVQLWLPDTRDPKFVEECRREALAIAALDAKDHDLMRFMDEVYEWPES
jgi:Protein  of unknown function (DUF3018)